LALARDSLKPLTGNHLGHTLGFSPASSPFTELFSQKKLAVISNVGSLVKPITINQIRDKSAALPPFLGSHTEQEQWVQGWLGDKDISGWAGRAFDLLPGYKKDFQPLIGLAKDYTLLLSKETQMSLTESNGGSLWGVADIADIKNLMTQKIEIFSKLQSSHDYESEFSRSLQSAYLDTIDFAKSQKTIPDPSGNFPSVQIGSDLKFVAKHLAYSKQRGTQRQIYLVQDGGYDTHSSQLSTNQSQPGLELLFGNVAKGIKEFDVSIRNYGLSDDVVTVVMSEFGRTLDPASGGGSDHGWGNHWFAIGGPVKGGVVYGDNFPSLTIGGADDASLWQPYRGQWMPQFSSDQFVADLLIWLGLSPIQVASTLPNLVNFREKTIGYL
jgi:uncharacterized protein (DUF1501 family)